MSLNRYNVQPGQVWVDNDPRLHGERKIRVESVDDTHAVCVVVAVRYGGEGRPTRIRLDRFKPTSTGYRLESAAEGENAGRALEDRRDNSLESDNGQGVAHAQDLGRERGPALGGASPRAMTVETAADITDDMLTLPFLAADGFPYRGDDLCQHGDGPLFPATILAPGVAPVTVTEFLDWLIRMEDPGSDEGREDRRVVTLTHIIERATAARSVLTPATPERTEQEREANYGSTNDFPGVGDTMAEGEAVERVARVIDPDAWGLSEGDFFEEYMYDGSVRESVVRAKELQRSRKFHSLVKASAAIAAYEGQEVSE